MALVAALSIAGAGAWLLAAQPHTVPGGLAGAAALKGGAQGSVGNAAPVGPLSSLPRSSGGPPAATASPGALQVVVDVVGHVRRPGLYRLPAGARVADALAAAGGATAGLDATTINRARKLIDGEQVTVGIPGPVAGVGPGGTAMASGGGRPSDLHNAVPVDLNSASVSQLDALPGVGPVLAQRIVDWRTAHGHFDGIDQLRSVSGIGDAKYADLKQLVAVS
jgi:competence protein ComEA